METDFIPQTQSPKPIKVSALGQHKSELASSTPTRWHPKLTVYRLLAILTTLGFSIVKAVLSYQGHSIVPITLEWLFSTGVFLLFFALDTYEMRVRASAFPWLFDVDVLQFTLTHICGLLDISNPVIYNTEDDARRPIVIRGSQPSIRGYDAGFNTGVTSVEWVSGAVVGVGMYWLGLYESSPIDQMPYLFSKDYTRDIKRTMKYTKSPLLVLFQILLVGFSAWWSYLCSGWLVSLSRDFVPDKPGETLFEKATATLVAPGFVVSGMMAVVATAFAAIFAISVVLMSKFHVAALWKNATLLWDYTSSFLILFAFLTLLVFLLSALALCFTFIPELITWTDYPFPMVMALLADVMWVVYFSVVIYYVVKVLRSYARQLGGVVYQLIGLVLGRGGIVRRGSMEV